MFDIIATLGPSASNKEQIAALCHSGITMVRINGAHGSVGYIDNIIKRVKGYGLDIKVMMDLPGNKIRTANLEEPLRVEKDKIFKLEPFQVNHSRFFRQIPPRTRITAYDSRYTFEVVGVEANSLVLKSHVTGMIENNKGLHIDFVPVQDDMDFIFDKDRELIEVALKNEIDSLGLSFVRSAEDIREIKEIIGDRKIQLISKIETKKAAENIQEIVEEVDVILIDRGDLSSVVGLLNVPFYEEIIIARARMKRGLRILLATQFLTNMVHSPIPSIAEVFSLYQVLGRSIDGIQLSEETAIGGYGPQCVRVIRDVLQKVRNNGGVEGKWVEVLL